MSQHPFVIGVALGIAQTAIAGPVTLNMTDRGYVRDDGIASSNTAYAAGKSGSIEYRNWYVFSLAGVTSPIIGGELRVYTYDIISNDSSETYQLTTTSTSAATLTARTGGTGVFGTLGTGTAVSSLTVQDGVDDYKHLVLTLNAAGVAAVNANLGGQIAFSGRLTTLDASSTEYVFARGQSLNSQLHLQDSPVIPLPGGAAMVMVGMGAGMGVIGVRRRRPISQDSLSLA